jgi:hypothetical protein
LGVAAKLFGSSVFVLRALALVAVAATCVALFRLSHAFEREGTTIGLLAAAFYIGFTATPEGLAGNPELILTPFVLWALVPIVRASVRGSPLGLRAAALAGIWLGIAVQIKTTALVEAAFALAFVAFATAEPRQRSALLLAGIALPTVMLAAAYAAAGQFGAFLDANVSSNARRLGYAIHTNVPFARTLGQEFKAFFPASLLAFGVPFAGADAPARERCALWWIVAWLLLDLLQVFAERERYPHQFLNAMAPAAILGAYSATALLRRFAPTNARLPALALLGAFAIGYHCIGNDVRAVRQLRGENLDSADAAVAYLRKHLGNRTFFDVDDRSLILVMVDRPLTSRYAPGFLTSEPMSQLAGIDGRAELDRIFATRPEVAIHERQNALSESPAEARDVERQLRDYVAVFCAGAHCVYERKAP